MNFYRVRTPNGITGYYARQAEAFAEAKPLKGLNMVYVELVDIPINKDAFTLLLNNDLGDIEETFKALRVWALTSRGGFVEEPVDG